MLNISVRIFNVESRIFDRSLLRVPLSRKLCCRCRKLFTCNVTESRSDFTIAVFKPRYAGIVRCENTLRRPTIIFRAFATCSSFANVFADVVRSNTDAAIEIQRSPTQRTQLAHVAKLKQNLSRPPLHELCHFINSESELCANLFADTTSITELAEAVARCVPDLSPKQILHACDLWFLVDRGLRHPQPISSIVNYLTASSNKSTAPLCDSMTKAELLHLLYYCSVYRLNPATLVSTVLVPCMYKYTSDLTWPDVDIIAQALFMLKINVSQVDLFTRRLFDICARALRTNETRVADVNMVLKYARQNAIEARDVVLALVDRLQRCSINVDDGEDVEEVFSALTCTSILQFLSYSKLVHVNVYQYLIDQFVQQLAEQRRKIQRVPRSLSGEYFCTTENGAKQILSLQNVTQLHYSHRVRCKDLARILLSVANVGICVVEAGQIVKEKRNRLDELCKISLDALMPIFEEISERVETGEFQRFHFEELIASGFAVCMLNCAHLPVNRVLMRTVLSEQFISSASRLEHKDTRRRLYQIFLFCRSTLPSTSSIFNSYATQDSEKLDAALNSVEQRLLSSLPHKDFFYFSFEMAQREHLGLRKFNRLLCDTFGKQNVIVGRSVPFIEVCDVLVHVPASDSIFIMELLDKSLVAELLPVRFRPAENEAVLTTKTTLSADSHATSQQKSAHILLGIVRMKRTVLVNHIEKMLSSAKHHDDGDKFETKAVFAAEISSYNKTNRNGGVSNDITSNNSRPQLVNVVPGKGPQLTKDVESLLTTKPTAALPPTTQQQIYVKTAADSRQQQQQQQQQHHELNLSSLPRNGRYKWRGRSVNAVNYVTIDYDDVCSIAGEPFPADRRHFRRAVLDVISLQKAA